MPKDWNIEHSRRANVNGVELEYQVVGSGEPILLIHGALLADCLIAPFQLHPIIMEKYRLISYHRCGYGGSGWPDGPISIEQQAEQCRLLLQHIGIDKAHIVGYSYGGLIALQLALSNPEVVHSLALMEPFLPRTDSKALEYGQQALGNFLQLYEAGDKAGALKNFLVAMAGPDILAASDMTLPLNAWEEGEAAVEVVLQKFFQTLAIVLYYTYFTPTCSASQIFCNTTEKITRWDFVESENRSPAYKDLLAKGLTESLVASKAKLVSTKTVGNIFLQLIFDVINPFRSADRVLNGPTNEVWIYPWLCHLQNMGVEYHFNSLAKSLEYDEEKGQIKSVTIRDSSTNEEYQVEGDYYVAALPIEVMAKLIRISKLTQYDSTLENIIRLAPYTAWMNGIQYYLKKDVPIAKAHVLYVDSPWALTSISQKQFWPDVDFCQYGDGQVEGILSVCISDWGPFHKPTQNNDAHEPESSASEDSQGIIYGKPAERCTDEEIAKEVWEQLKQSLNVDGKEILRDENLHSWFLDPSIINVDQELFHWMCRQSCEEISLEAIEEYLEQE